tara:strand:+ start:2775 stop:3332 length:558 start_codon:yes stop_codon:yes gene_type:complete
MKKDKFVKMKTSFDMATYNQSLVEAKRKLSIVNEAYEWCNNHIDNSKMNKNEFVFDMTKEFSRCLKEQKGDAVKIEISVEKLMFLLDIEISMLGALKSEFSSIKLELKVVDDLFNCEVIKEDYQSYTTSQEQNDKLIAGNNLVKALEMVSKYTKVYPLNIQQGTSGFLQFQLSKNSYNVRLHDMI